MYSASQKNIVNILDIFKKFFIAGCSFAILVEIAFRSDDYLTTSLVIADVLAQYDEWYQFAFTYDTATGDVILYKNGQEIQTKSFEPKIPFNNLVTEFANALYVGAWSTFVEGDSVQTWQSYWAGGLDEIRLYNKAFSANEMLELYKEELNINLEQE